jgi:nitroreductase
VGGSTSADQLIAVDLFDVVLSQRACRHFTDEPVPDGDVERILTAATHAPSAENTQPWVFVVVRDAGRRAAISELARTLWTGGARSYAQAHVDERMIASIDASVADGFGSAPVLIVVGADLDSGVHASMLGSSIFPAVQNLMLAASALGYGSALTTLTTLVADQLREIVDLAPRIEPLAVVPLGRPARKLGPPRRAPIAAKAHRERYGIGW